MSDGTIIVCADWSEQQLMALPGNRTATCDRCSAPIVISLPGRKLQADPPELPVVILCFRCALAEDPDQPFQSVPGAVELAAEFGVSREHLERHQTMTVGEFIRETQRRGRRQH